MKRRSYRRSRVGKRRRLGNLGVLGPVRRNVNLVPRRKRLGAPLSGRVGKRRYVSARRPPQERPTGVSITQWSTRRKRFSLAKKRTRVNNALRLINASRDPVMLAWNGVKNFDDNGYYWLSNSGTTEFRKLPVYLYDLTSIINSGGCLPFQMLQSDGNGRMYFVTQNHAGLSGITTNTPEIETISQFSFERHGRAHLQWVNINLNCWGCKTKSTRFYIDVVRFKDEDLVPKHNDAADYTYGTGTTQEAQKRTQFFQDMVKTLTFNPSSFSRGLFYKRLHRYRSMSFILDPNTTIEEDNDPAVKQVKLFLRLDRVVDYRQGSNPFGTIGAVADTSSIGGNLQEASRSHTKGDSRLYLLIRATNFGVDAEDSNTLTPSFDLRVRQKFMIPSA